MASAPDSTLNILVKLPPRDFIIETRKWPMGENTPKKAVALVVALKETDPKSDSLGSKKTSMTKLTCLHHRKPGHLGRDWGKNHHKRPLGDALIAEVTQEVGRSLETQGQSQTHLTSWPSKTEGHGSSPTSPSGRTAISTEEPQVTVSTEGKETSPLLDVDMCLWICLPVSTPE